MSEASGTPRKKRFPVTLDLSSPAVAPKRNDILGTKTKASWQTLKPAAQLTVARHAPVSQIHSSSTDALRMRMIERLRAQGIGNEMVLRAMSQVPRHLFVDAALRNQAYEDTSLPIGLEQTISKPSVVATMLSYLVSAEKGRLHSVLDIGTGCGYQAAVLSLLADKVYSVERLKGLHERARINLRPLALKNVHLIYGDGSLGLPAGAPFDAIVAAASGLEIPVTWLEQMTVGGALIAPLTLERERQALVKIVRTAQGWHEMILESVQFVPLKAGTS